MDTQEISTRLEDGCDALRYFFEEVLPTIVQEASISIQQFGDLIKDILKGDNEMGENYTEQLANLKDDLHELEQSYAERKERLLKEISDVEKKIQREEFVKWMQDGKNAFLDGGLTEEQATELVADLVRKKYGIQ